MTSQSVFIVEITLHLYLVLYFLNFVVFTLLSGGALHLLVLLLHHILTLYLSDVLVDHGLCKLLATSTESVVVASFILVLHHFLAWADAEASKFGI